VEILSVIPPDEFNHWIGVGEVMRAEARERIEAHFNVFAKWMRDRQGVDPTLVIREGEPVDQILGPYPRHAGDRGPRPRRRLRQGRTGAAGHGDGETGGVASGADNHRPGRAVQGTIGTDHLSRSRLF
jgi:hypothetical protein